MTETMVPKNKSEWIPDNPCLDCDGLCNDDCPSDYDCTDFRTYCDKIEAQLVLLEYLIKLGSDGTYAVSYETLDEMRKEIA